MVCARHRICAGSFFFVGVYAAVTRCLRVVRRGRESESGNGFGVCKFQSVAKNRK